MIISIEINVESESLEMCEKGFYRWPKSQSRGRFHKKSQFETSFGLSLGLKSETFVSAEFLAQMNFTKGGSAETGLKS